MNKDLTIAVVSDLHCKGNEGKGIIETQTFLTTDLPPKPIYRHPIEALKKTIKEENLSADIVLCPGDLTDRIDKAGLFGGLKFLKEIQTSLKAEHLYICTGNHDVDSRKKHTGTTPFDLVKTLIDDGYPTQNKSANQKYWSDNYCIIEEVNSLLLLFNSSYSHIDDEKCQKCVVSNEILEAIETELENYTNCNKHKICLLHHHPDHHSNFDLKYTDADFVQNGDRFLDILQKNGFSIVVHGHKHEPKLRYRNELPLFASGSFSSLMNIVDISAQNTFHLIQLKQTSRNGKIKTWVYGATKGWTQQIGTYFPCETGFGCFENTESLAQECSDYFSKHNKEFMLYSDLISKIPKLDFLIPQKQAEFEHELEKNHKLKIYPSIFLKPEYIIRLVNG